MHAFSLVFAELNLNEKKISKLRDEILWVTTKEQYVQAVNTVSNGIQKLATFSGKALKDEMQLLYDNRWDFENALDNLFAGKCILFMLMIIKISFIIVFLCNVFRFWLRRKD